MAFGVKWNDTGEESSRQSAELQAPGAGASSPRRRQGPPGADAGAARRARRLHPPTAPQTGRERGGGGGTEPSAIFPYSPKHTHKLPGRPLRGEPSPAPQPAPRALARPGAWGRGQVSPLPGPRPPKEEPCTRTRPSPSFPHRGPAVGPGKARRPGTAGYSPHDTGVFSSEPRHAEAAQSRDKADPGCIPGPGGTGDKVYREAAADVENWEAAQEHRNLQFAAPAL